MKEITDIANRSLTIALGADHGGFEAKNEISSWLQSSGHKVLDCGAFVADKEDDYPDFASPAAMAVSNGDADAVVLFCRSGLGMAIVANRFHGVRAVVAADKKAVELSRRHNASNCLVLGGDQLSVAEMKELITEWL